MLTRTQLLLLTIMATLGGSFAGLLVVGIFASDLMFAAINLGLIVVLFGFVFVMSGEKPKKQKRAGDVHVGGELNPELFESSEMFVFWANSTAEMMEREIKARESKTADN